MLILPYKGSIPRGLPRQKMVFKPDTSQLAAGSGFISYKTPETFNQAGFFAGIDNFIGDLA